MVCMQLEDKNLKQGKNQHELYWQVLHICVCPRKLSCINRKCNLTNKTLLSANVMSFH